MRQITNPYWSIVIFPLLAFLIMMAARVEPDTISLASRIYTFLVLGYVSSRYVGRAPFLMWERDLSPEARNVTGWSLSLVGFMFQIAYGWLYIAYDRPEWLSSQYWNASFVVLIAVGLTLVASSVPRIPPFGDNRYGLSEFTSMIVVIVSALGVFVASHIPQAIALFKSLFGGFTHAL